MRVGVRHRDLEPQPAAVGDRDEVHDGVQLPAGLVRVVHAGDRLWALKELPRWAAEREHAALVAMERRSVPAVRPAGLVTALVGAPYFLWLLGRVRA